MGAGAGDKDEEDEEDDDDDACVYHVLLSSWLIIWFVYFNHYRSVLINNIGIVGFTFCFDGCIDDHKADDIVSVAP